MTKRGMRTINPMVNVGTAERQELVPAAALKPDTPKGREFWGNVASGTVSLSQEALGRLLQRTRQDDPKS